MATYAELYDLNRNSDLRNRVTVACYVAADEIRAESAGTTNHANRLLWAARVYADPEGEGAKVYRAVLAANRAATTAQILAATDATIQSAVDAAVNLFAGS